MQYEVYDTFEVGYYGSHHLLTEMTSDFVSTTRGCRNSPSTFSRAHIWIHMWERCTGSRVWKPNTVHQTFSAKWRRASAGPR